MVIGARPQLPQRQDATAAVTMEVPPLLLDRVDDRKLVGATRQKELTTTYLLPTYLLSYYLLPRSNALPLLLTAYTYLLYLTACYLGAARQRDPLRCSHRAAAGVQPRLLGAAREPQEHRFRAATATHGALAVTGGEGGEGG